MSLRPFRAIPRNLREWTRWMQLLSNPPSDPPSGKHKITNIYWNPTTSEIEVEIEDDPA